MNRGNIMNREIKIDPLIVAYLAMGAMQFLQEQKKVDLEHFNGQSDFIEQVIESAAMISAAHTCVDNNSLDRGVFLYDIVEPFGYGKAYNLYHSISTPDITVLSTQLAVENYSIEERDQIIDCVKELAK